MSGYLMVIGLYLIGWLGTFALSLRLCGYVDRVTVLASARVAFGWPLIVLERAFP